MVDVLIEFIRLGPGDLSAEEWAAELAEIEEALNREAPIRLRPSEGCSKRRPEK